MSCRNYAHFSRVFDYILKQEVCSQKNTMAESIGAKQPALGPFWYKFDITLQNFKVLYIVFACYIPLELRFILSQDRSSWTGAVSLSQYEHLSSLELAYWVHIVDMIWRWGESVSCVIHFPERTVFEPVTIIPLQRYRLNDLFPIKTCERRIQ